MTAHTAPCGRKRAALLSLWHFPCLLLCLCLLLPGAALAEPVVVQVSGKAEMRANAASSWQKLRTGTPLPAGAAVRVQGGGSVTVHDKAAGTTIKTGPDSELGYEGTVVLPESSQSPGSGKPVPSYSLPEGKADISVDPGNNIDLLTPLLLTSVRGTRYTASVARDGSSAVAVGNGVVLTLDKFGNKARLSAGQQIGMTATEYIGILQTLPNLRKVRDPGSDGGGDGAGSGGGGAGSGGDGGDD